ncbi:MAG: protease pro-enzyme activation domain-containing protein, partial [Terriglobia bacterium]
MRRIYWSVAFLMLSAAGLHAQTLTTTVGAGNRLQASALPAPDAGQAGLVTLRGNTRPEANAKNDRGRVSDDLTLNHMMLQLRRSPAQEQALQQFINDIHDHTSPLFHHWITATEFGQRYGVAPAEVARVTDWLQSQGFKVNLVYPNQMVIDFTGSAGQIRQAFHTEIHHLLVNGQAHIANMSDPQIPAALASTVAGVVSLNDFRAHSTLRRHANYTVTSSGPWLVAPADLWTIYNFNPAFAQGISGQGQTIVLIEDTDLYTTQDWSDYRSVF